MLQTNRLSSLPSAQTARNPSNILHGSGMSNRGAFKGRPISGFKGRPITMLFDVKAIINNLSLTCVPRIISNHLFQHQIKYKLLKNKFNDNTLVYDEKVPRHF